MLRSIQARLLVLVLATFVPVTALIGIGLWNDWRDAQAEAAKRAVARARLMAAHVDDELRSLENLLAGLSRAVSPDPADVNANDAVLRHVKADLPDYISNILLFDLNGRNIGTSWEGKGGRNYVGDRDFFRQILAGVRFSVGEPVHGRTTHRWISGVARPVQDLTGKLRAVLVSGIQLEHFQDALGQRELPAGSVVRIIDENGIVISQNVDGPNWVGRDLSKDPAATRRLASGEGSDVVRWPDDVERITGSSPVHKAPWLVSVGFPPDVVVAATISRLHWDALFGAVALALAFAIAWRFSRAIVHPLQQLGKDASVLAAGELSYRTAVRTRDEIGALAQNFNLMAAALERREKEARRLAHYDQLTGLPNRLLLQKKLGRRLASHQTTPTAVVLMDLDGFKNVNDTLGHSVGDELLVEVGHRLITIAENWEHGGRIYRLGGDEFVVVIADYGDPRPIAEFVDLILRRLAEPFLVNDQILNVAASAGIAIAPNDGSTVDELIANADLALYQAKSEGRRAYRFFVPVLRAQAQAQRTLNAELTRAFGENEFEIYFQPQIRLSDQVVVGAEALLRWRHPVRGLLAPGCFIQALAASSVATEVGRWIIRTACAQAAAWRARGLGLDRVAVNLFPAQANDSELSSYVQCVLQETGLAANALELEITENAVLDCLSPEAPLRRLHEKGVQLAFDDFGTGYASLSYLTRFPVSRIKIDRSFVARITESRQDAAIVRSLISIAHNLGLAVVAEGVETEAQAEFLLREGCEEAQGFLYAKPLPAAEFQDYVEAQRVLSAGNLLGREQAMPKRRA